MAKKVLGKIPGVPSAGHGSTSTGARAPKPTSVRASSPQGAKINPHHTSGTQTSVWYKDVGSTEYAIDKD